MQATVPILEEQAKEAGILFKPNAVATVDGERHPRRVALAENYRMEASTYVLYGPDFTVVSEEGVRKYPLEGMLRPRIRHVSETVILPGGKIVFNHVKNRGVYIFESGSWVEEIKGRYSEIYPNLAKIEEVEKRAKEY